MKINIFFTLLGAILGATLPAQAVVHGQPVPDGHMKSVVKIVTLDAKGDIYSSCTGVFITDSVVLTAGHCVIGSPRICLHAVGNEALASRVCTSQSYTEAVEDEADKEDGSYLDLGLVKFPAGTAPEVAAINFSPDLTIGRALSFVGYGTIYESFVDMAAAIIDGPDVVHKNIGISSVDSVDTNFISLFQQETGTFADNGDSGSPVFADGKVIGIMVTAYRDEHVNPHPETGSLYGVYNQIVRLDTPRAQSFLSKNVK